MRLQNVAYHPSAASDGRNSTLFAAGKVLEKFNRSWNNFVAFWYISRTLNRLNLTFKLLLPSPKLTYPENHPFLEENCLPTPYFAGSMLIGIVWKLFPPHEWDIWSLCLRNSQFSQYACDPGVSWTEGEVGRLHEFPLPFSVTSKTSKNGKLYETVASENKIHGEIHGKSSATMPAAHGCGVCTLWGLGPLGGLRSRRGRPQLVFFWEGQVEKMVFYHEKW